MFEIRNSHAFYRNFMLSNYEYKKKWFTMEEILTKESRRDTMEEIITKDWNRDTMEEIITIDWSRDTMEEIITIENFVTKD